MQIIALTGPKGAGKSTIAQFLVEQHGFQRMRFADPVKRMLRAMGLSEEHIDGALKEAPVALLGGKSTRFAMQTLATAWGRKTMTWDIWVNVMRTDILSVVCENPGAKIVVDDLRFPNEELLMRELGAIKWRVRRKDVEASMSVLDKWLARRGLHRRLHVSETYWPDFAVHQEIHNDGSVDALLAAAHKAANSIPVYTLEEVCSCP